MCGTITYNTPERKCFKQTLIAIDKSIDKGNELLNKLIKQDEPKRKI